MRRSKVLLWIAILVFAVLSLGGLSACGKQYTVTFNGNGGFLLSGETEQTVNSSGKLEPPVFAKYGYDFSGWDVELSTIKEDTEVKAVWKVAEYKIIFDLNGGRENVVNAKKYTIESDDITLNEPLKSGYEFKGWTGGGITTPTKEVVIKKGSYGNKTYTAHWEIKQYTITYHLNEGTQVEASPASYTIVSSDQHIKNPVREGYDFVGWTGTGLTLPSTNVIIKTGSYGDKVYTANWKPKEFQITFDLNGGTSNGSTSVAPITAVFDKPIGTLPVVEADGKIFDGWYYGDEKVSSTTVFDKQEDIELVAKFADYYTVKFVLSSMVGNVKVDCLYDGNTEKADERVDTGGKLEKLMDAEAHPKYSGQYDFDYWAYVLPTGQEIKITKDTVFSKDVFTHSTIYIVAKSKPAPWTPPITD